MIKYKKKRDKKHGEWADGNKFFWYSFVLLRLSLSVSHAILRLTP